MRWTPALRIRCRDCGRRGRSVARYAAGGLFGLVATVGLLAWGAGARGAAQTGMPGSTCTAGGCHVDQRESGHLHRPVVAGACGICHRTVSVERHEFRLARTGSDLCRTCHVGIAATDNVHTGLGQRGTCLMCHDAHGTGHRFLLSAAHVVEACESCHLDLLNGRSDMHLAVAAQPCTLCHDPHGSDRASARAEEPQLCLHCHVTVRTELESRPHAHLPARQGNCNSCHAGHDSDEPGKLLQPVPGLCYSCHDTIRETVQTAEHQHSVASAPGGCLVCHEPHASDLGFGLRADPFTLCGSCHTEDIAMPGQVIPALADQLEGRFLHGPVRQRDCGACHDSHGSDHFRLLIDEYPPEFYASFTVEKYGLCFGCHPERAMLTPETTELTEFRNGAVNLHYAHVTKPRNGRTCRACHATHGSDLEKHMRPWVPFGEWKLPIDFERTVTGGRCDSGCHVAKSYDRQAPLTRDAADAPGERSLRP